MALKFKGVKVGDIMRPIAIGLAAATGNVPLAMGIAAASSAGISVADKDKLGEGLLKATLSAGVGAAGAGVATKLGILPGAASDATDLAAGPVGSDVLGAPSVKAITSTADPATVWIPEPPTPPTPPKPPTPMTKAEKTGFGLDAAQLALMAQAQLKPTPPAPRLGGVPYQPLPLSQIPPIPQNPPLFGV